MKKILLIALLAIVSIGVKAEIASCGKKGSNITWSLNEDSVLTLSGSGEMYYYFDSNYHDNRVPWRNYRTSIKNVLIDEGITNIYGGAFEYCSNLVSITLPSSITSIGENSFYNCISLSQITLPDSLEIIGNYAFLGCTSLTEINIPYKVQQFSYSTFANCTNLSNVIVHSNTKLVSSAWMPFKGCDNLKTVRLVNENYQSINEQDFPSTVLFVVPTSLYDTYLENYSSCSYRFTTEEYLKQVIIDVNENKIASAVLNSIGTNNIEKITSLKVKGSINSYDFMVFRNKMPRLKWLDLSDAIIVANNYEYYDGLHSNDNEIGAHIFDEKSLFEIKLPKTMASIATGAFSGCTSLLSVDLGENVTEIKSSAFSGCTSLRMVKTGDAIKAIGSSAFKKCENLTDINLPESVEKIDSYAFYGCSKLEKLSMPNVASIGYAAFCNCEKIKVVVLPKISSIEDYAFQNCIALSKVILSDNLSKIPENSFRGDVSLTEVQLGANTESIESYAFQGCYNLSSIIFPNKMTRISNEAFSGCSSLKEIRIPSSIQYIADKAFVNCNNIKAIYVETVIPISIEQSTFSDVCYNSATLYYPSQSKEEYYWHTVWGKFLNQDYLASDYEYSFIYLDGDKILNSNTGKWEGCPEIEISKSSGLITKDNVNQDAKKIIVHHDGTSSGSVISYNNSLIANELTINIDIERNKWYFFCFPYDIELDKIKYDGDCVWRTYNSQERANTGNGWVKVSEDKLIAGKGYIFQGNATDKLVANVNNPEFSVGDISMPLEKALSSDASNASWNYIGNPYLSYYSLGNIAKSNFTAPITRWTGSTYEAVSPIDDSDVTLRPLEAFFVQKPLSNDAIVFYENGQQTKSQSTVKANSANERMAVARHASEYSCRQLINLTISDVDENVIDKTRIVFNNERSINYESECDASKFISDNALTQLYSIDQFHIQYAINERPLENGNVTLGLIVQKEGDYTISTTRLDRNAKLIDKYEGKIVDLSDGNSYTFSSKSGTFNDRFELSVCANATSIKDSFGEKETYNDDINIYNIAGSHVDSVQKGGVYIIKNGKNSSKILRK